jgi:hypothetical protein
MTYSKTGDPTLKMADVILSSSARFYPIVIELRDELQRAGLSVQTPNLKFVAASVSPSRKRQLTIDFLAKISKSRCVCVVTDESGYVGRSVSLEVGFGYAIGKPLVCLQDLEDPAISCLCEKLSSAEALIRFVRTLRSRDTPLNKIVKTAE